MDPYVVLGLQKGASIDEIRQAFREKTKKYHPDLGGDEWIFFQVQEAYRMLVDAQTATPNAHVSGQNQAHSNSVIDSDFVRQDTFSANKNRQSLNADSIRRNHVNAEVNLRLLGVFDVMSAVGVLILGVMSLMAGMAVASDPFINGDPNILNAVGILLSSLGLFNIGLGYKLTRFDNSARIISAIEYIPMLLSPGFLPAILMLYILLNKKSAYICTPEYAKIKLLTPHIRAKMSPILIFFLGLLCLAIIVIIIAAMNSQI